MESDPMKKDLKKLRQARADKAKVGKTKVEALNALLAKDELNETETAQLATLETEVDALETDVAALDKEIATEEKLARRATLFGSTARVPQFSVTTDEPNPALTGGFRNLSEFAVAVRNQIVGGANDPRLNAAPSNYEQNQGTAGEGFLVPTEYRQQIWSLVFAENDLLSLCNPEPTNSNAISIPKDETTPWGSTGVQATWRSEASQLTASKFTATGTIVQLHELYAFVLATSELLDDAPRLNNRLTVQAARAIKWKASEAVAFGDGNGKPLGFMNAGCLVTVAKDSGQAAKTLSLNNVLTMYSRLLFMGGNPVWLANADTLPQLAQLTVGNVPAWLPLNQPVAGDPRQGIFLGRPLMFNEHMQTLGTLGDIAAADLTGYALATKAGGGIDFAASIHLFFDYNMQAFRWIFRLGGQPYLSAAVTPAKGSNTKSHFVALAAR
jgi:HK97 family phage major capsid protein